MCKHKQWYVHEFNNAIINYVRLEVKYSESEYFEYARATIVGKQSIRTQVTTFTDPSPL